MKAGAIIPQKIVENSDLPCYVKIVYGRVFVLTTDELAKQCGITRREAAKSLRYLVSLGLIRFHRSLENRSYIHVIQSSVPQ